MYSRILSFSYLLLRNRERERERESVCVCVCVLSNIAHRGNGGRALVGTESKFTVAREILMNELE